MGANVYYLVGLYPVVIRYVLRSRGGRPVAEISIMGPEKLSSNARRGGNHDFIGAHAETEQRAVGFGESRESLVGLGPELREVPEDGPALGAWRQRAGPVALPIEEEEEE